MKNRSGGHVISNLFAFVLIGVFAVMSTLLVLYGARGYQDAVRLGESHNNDRVAGAFILGAVRSEDREGAVSINRIDGTDVLEIRSTYSDPEGDSDYVRRLYCSDGMLKDLFTSDTAADDPDRKAFSPSDPDTGNEICALRSMKLTLENGLLTAQLEHADGTVSTVNVAVRTDSGSR